MFDARPAPASRQTRSARGPIVALATLMLAALAPVLVSCAEAPSYELRWTLVDADGFADPDQAAPLRSVQQCSGVGVSKIRVTTRRLDNSVADRREYPCFPGAFERGELVEGPSALEPGEYKLEIEGLRRGGGVWGCVEDADLPEPAPCVAFAEATVTVTDDAVPSVEFVLLSPPECDDGIDNDGDGRVDGKDFSCLLDPDGPEQSDDSLAVFQISLSFLASAAVFPADVSVDGFRLAIDGEPLDEVSADELVVSQWPFRLPLVSANLEAGSYELSVVGLDQDGAAVTVPKLQSFDVPGPNLEPLFDFSGEDFLEPILEPISVSLGMRLNPDDLTGPPCTLAGYVDGALVTIDRTWVRVLDDQGVALDAATLGLTGSSSEGAIVPVDELDGWVSLACPTSMVVSTPLLWGNYTIDIQSRIGDSVCFETAETLDLAPQGKSGAQGLMLDRVVDAMGVPPPGCEECVVTSDCSGQVCDAGICKDN